MKKINEASTLSALGLDDKDISRLHTLPVQLPHDMEFVPVKTKSEATTYIKQKHLLVGINDAGESVGILFDKDYRSSTYHVVKDGKARYAKSLKDALAFLPGKAKWYRSVESVTSPRDNEWESERAEQDFIYAIVEKVERIYGDRLRKEARKYMKEIRNAIGSAVTQDKRPKDGFGNAPPIRNLESLKKGYDDLESIAKSKTPFRALSKVRQFGWDSNYEGFAGTVAAELATDRYNQYDPTRAGEWAMKTPAATAKIVRFAFSQLRKIRDNAFGNYHKQKSPVEAEPYQLRVREAYDRYVRSGAVESLTLESNTLKTLDPVANKDRYEAVHTGTETTAGVDRYEPDVQYFEYDIYLNGERVGELTDDDYMGYIRGKLHNKDLPELSNYGKNPQEALRKFLSTKTGARWAANIEKYRNAKYSNDYRIK